ncbi:MAG: hypothetical protein KBG30_09955 [Bacteroidales bacterium]|nr:hypothetical protein [Bacteroidales bacterium]
MEQQSQQPQTQEKPKKSVWKKWWFWLIIIVIILIGSIIISDHTSKVNYCKDQCIHCNKGGWTRKGTIFSYLCSTTGSEPGDYKTEEDCIKDCLVGTDWAKVKY